MGDFKSFMYDLTQGIDKETISAECCVHFLPKADWNGKDYGFDWMRFGGGTKIVPFGDADPYEKIVGKLYIAGTGYKTLVTDPNEYKGDFKCDKALYEKLEGDYSWLQMPWKKDPNDPNKKFHYYSSWLSLYPSTQSPDPYHSSNGEAQLRLYLDVKEAPDRLEFEDNECFDISPKVIDSGLKSGADFWDKGKVVTVKCKKPTSFDQTIKVYAVKKNSITGNDEQRLAGQLRISANNGGRQKKLKVMFVHVKLPARSIPTTSTSASTSASTTLVTRVINTPPGNSKNQRELINSYLRQALISADVSVTDLDLSNDANFKYGGCYRYMFQGKSGPDSRVIANDGRLTNSISLDKYMYSQLEQKLNGRDVSEYKRVYFFGEGGGNIVVGAAGPQYVGLGGYNSQTTTTLVGVEISSVHSNDIVIFSPYDDHAVTHEILHSLGLPHTFTNKNAKFTYHPLSTENIMDYSCLNNEQCYSLWHWQWKIANGNVK